jgi:hypothetical protein
LVIVIVVLQAATLPLLLPIRMGKKSIEKVHIYPPSDVCVAAPTGLFVLL